VKQLDIAFIGAGNMARGIIGGLVDQGWDPQRIRAGDPVAEALDRLRAEFGVTTRAANSEVVEGADVVVLAVKPRAMSAVTADIREAVRRAGALVISIAAGITIESLERGLGADVAIVRCMPNTPALLRQGATAFYANAATDTARREQAESILGAVGTVRRVAEESMLDAVTALSGSGPAYFFLFMEAMVAAGEALGLDRDTSRELTIQTGVGSARMAAGSDADLVELRRRVTSPGGTTERAIESFEQSGLRDAVEAAMRAAAERAEELGRESG